MSIAAKYGSAYLRAALAECLIEAAEIAPNPAGAYPSIGKIIGKLPSLAKEEFQKFTDAELVIVSHAIGKHKSLQHDPMVRAFWNKLDRNSDLIA